MRLDRAVVLFTRDLRVHDHPALAAAHREARSVVRLFVRDPSLPAPVRRRGLLESLLRDVPDLRTAHGDPVEEVARFAPDAVYCSRDASPYARRRERRLAERFDLRLHPGSTVVDFDDLKPYKVFTPYHRAWSQAPRRDLEDPPSPAPETDARRALAAFLQTDADSGSRLGAYLHFGALSPLECVARGAAKPEFVRRLAWRDFYAQLLRADPARFALGAPDEGGELFAAWRAGRTGYPLVDAGLRQLELEGYMPNRVRLVVASFLVHDLGLDWRLGARHFEELLLDADVASNRGNWLWVAENTRRVFNPVLQAERLADYVRRFVTVDAGYPDPVIAPAGLAVKRRRRRLRS